MSSTLLLFTHRLLDFRLAETYALLDMLGLDKEAVLNEEEVKQVESPFVFADFPSLNSLLAFSERSILLKTSYEVIARASTYDELVEEIREKKEELEGQINHAGESGQHKTWSFDVTAFNYKLPPARKNEIREYFHFLDWQGDVNLADPDVIWAVLEERDITGENVLQVCVCFQQQED